MATSPLTKSALRTLLLVALLHQMSACACGCLEHNAWFQAAKSLAVGGHGHTHQFPHDSSSPHDSGNPDEDSAAHKHCDAEMLVYLKAQGVANLTQDVRLVGVSPAASCCSNAALRPTVAGLRDLASESPSLDVRAHFQVMQI